MANDEQLRELEERYEGYTVYDNAGEKIGKVDDLFVDETDREEYIGVKMGLFGLSGTTLIPMDVVRVDERERSIEVSETREHVKDGPNFSDDDDITPEYEERIRRHFGLESPEPSAGRGSYGRGAGAAGGAAVGGGSSTEDRDRGGRESYRNREDMGDESAMESSGAGAATPSGGVRDLETGGQGGMGGLEAGDRGGVEDESFREGYREGFREGYREGAHEGATEPGGRGDLGTSGSTFGAGGTEGGARDLDRGERESIASSETRDRDRGESIGSSGTRDRDMDRDRGERGGREGEQRDEGVGTKVWRRIRS